MRLDSLLDQYCLKTNADESGRGKRFFRISSRTKTEKRELCCPCRRFVRPLFLSPLLLLNHTRRCYPSRPLRLLPFIETSAGCCLHFFGRFSSSFSNTHSPLLPLLPPNHLLLPQRRRRRRRRPAPERPPLQTPASPRPPRPPAPPAPARSPASATASRASAPSPACGTRAGAGSCTPRTSPRGRAAARTGAGCRRCGPRAGSSASRRARRGYLWRGRRA